MPATSFAETLQHAVADADRERRELLEHLLAGELPAHGPLRARRRATASRRRAAAVVVRPARWPTPPRPAPRWPARRSAPPARWSSSATARCVAVAALSPGCGSRKVCDRVAAPPRAPARGGLPLALGVSLPAHGVAELPRAFAEARAALECVAARAASPRCR